MCYWRWLEKISCTDCVRNEEVLHRAKEERNILQTKRRRKANWIGQIWRGNCLLKHVIEGETEGRMEVRGNEEDDVSRYRMTLRKSGVMKLERGSTRQHCVEEADDLCNTDYGMNG